MKKCFATGFAVSIASIVLSVYAQDATNRSDRPLPGDACVAGHVLNHDGTPAKGLHLTLLQIDTHSTPHQSRRHDAHTDRNGYFSFKGLMDGWVCRVDVFWQIDDNMHSPPFHHDPITTGDTNVVITLDPYCLIEGTVKNPEGRLVSCQFNVEHASNPRGFSGGWSGSGPFQPDSKFACILGTGSLYRLRFSHPAYPDECVIRDFSSTNLIPQKEHIDVVMGQGLTLTGTLIAGEQPLEGCYVIALERRHDVDLSQSSIERHGGPPKTQANGHFVIRGVRPGILTLAAYQPAQASFSFDSPAPFATMRMLVSTSETPPVVFDVGTLATITGQVIDAHDQGISNMTVTLQPNRASDNGRVVTPTTSACTDPSGAFAFRSVCSGGYSVSAHGQDYAIQIGPQQVLVNNGNANQIVLRVAPPPHTWTAIGRLMTNDTLARAGTISVWFNKETDAVISSNGIFVLTNASAGTHEFAFHPAQISASNSFGFSSPLILGTLTLQEDQTNFVAHLQGVSVAGSLKDSQGHPVTNQSITLFTPMTNMTIGGTSLKSCDPNGHFCFDLVPQGSYALDTPGIGFAIGIVKRASASFTVGATNEFHELTLPTEDATTRKIQVAGSVCDEYGQPVSQASLLLEVSNCTAYATSEGNKGQFKFEFPLYPAEYTLRVYKDGYVPSSKTVALLSDTNMNLVLAFSGNVVVGVTHNNHPATNVTVRAYDTHYVEIPSTLALLGREGPHANSGPKTDNRGMALLAGLPVGTCIIKADGYAAETTVDIRRVETTSTTLALP